MQLVDPLSLTPLHGTLARPPAPMLFSEHDDSGTAIRTLLVASGRDAAPEAARREVRQGEPTARSLAAVEGP